MKDDMILYISGPMTGLEEFNYPTFNLVAKELRAQGFTVISPAETEESLGFAQGSQTWPWQTWMRHALRSLLECDAIVMLPGWYRSKGARAELDIALDLEMDIFKVITHDDSRTLDGNYITGLRVAIEPIDAGFAEVDRV
jgi:hypothetical protein